MIYSDIAAPREILLEVPATSDPVIGFTVSNGPAEFGLAGATLELYIKGQVSEVDFAPTYTSSSGVTVVDASNGICTVQFDQSDLMPGGYRWHLDAVVGPDRTVLVSGTLIARPR